LAALALGQGVFGLRISERQAKDVLRRKPRSPKNSGFFEEVGGNADMQRECYDELCSMEEYSEASDMTKQTKTDVEGGYDQLRFPCNYAGCHVENTQLCEAAWGSAKCVCKPGYTGETCSENLDECETWSPCGENGDCIDTIGSYTCNCKVGYAGVNCDEDVDECLLENMCGNGTCINDYGGFTCECQIGFTGDYCDIDIDECDLENQSGVFHTCGDNEVCKNTVGGYECPCVGGYTGEYCEEDLDECILDPCPEGSSCETPEFNMFRCVCPEQGCSFPLE